VARRRGKISGNGVSTSAGLADLGDDSFGLFRLPSDHRLASRETVSLQDLGGETFIGMADQAPVHRSIIEDYIRRSGLDLEPAQGRISLHGDITRCVDSWDSVVAELCSKLP